MLISHSSKKWRRFVKRLMVRLKKALPAKITQRLEPQVETLFLIAAKKLSGTDVVKWNFEKRFCEGYSSNSP